MEWLVAEVMKLGSLTEGEAFLIRCGWEILSDKRWRCEACVKTTSEPQRRTKGCFGSTRYTLGDYSIRGCVGNRYSPAVFFWWRVYQASKLGVMPEAGGILDQSAKWIDIFQAWEALEAEHAEKERKAQESKGAKRG